MPKIAIAEQPTCVPNEGGQQGFCQDTSHRVVSLEGGWFSGKTWAGARKLLETHTINAFSLQGRATFILSFVVAPTYSNCMDFCVPELHKGLEEMGLKGKYKGSGSLGGGKFAAPAIVIPEFGTRNKPSVILIRSADVAKRITGFTAGCGWGDEPARWKSDPFNPLDDAYIQMLGRVRGQNTRLLQLIFTYTNEGDTTKIYEEMHDGNPQKKLYRAATRSNPYAKEFEETQRTILTDELVTQYLDGTAINLRGGKVYTKWDFDIHVKSEIHLRKDVPLQLSVDFNIVPGMHGLLGQWHPDSDILTELHEFYGPRLTVEGMMELVVHKLSEMDYEVTEELPLEIYGDATGGSEWSGTGASNYYIIQNFLKAQGIPYVIRVPAANPLVSDRINAVNCALMDITGGVHYYVHFSCKRLITDFKMMQRDKFGLIATNDQKLSHASSAIGYKIWWIRPVRVDVQNRPGRFNV